MYSVLPGLKIHPIKEQSKHKKHVFCPQAVRCDGAALLPYQIQLLEVLHSVLKLKSLFGFEVSGQFLKHFLRGLTQIYPLSLRSVDEDFDRPFTEYMPIKVCFYLLIIDVCVLLLAFISFVNVN